MEDYVGHKKCNSDLESRSRPVQPRIGEYRYHLQQHCRISKSNSTQPINSDFQRIHREISPQLLQYALPLLTVAGLTLNIATFVNSKHKLNISVASISQPMYPRCMTTEDGESPESSIPVYPNLTEAIIESTDIITEVVEGVSASFESKGRTYSIKQLEEQDIKPAQSDFIICDSEDEKYPPSINQISETKEITGTTIYTVPITHEPSKIKHLEGLDLNITFTPGEPTVRIAKNPVTGKTLLIGAANNVVNFSEVIQNGNKFEIHKRVESLDILKLFKNNECPVIGDVQLFTGPNGEIGIIYIRSASHKETCMLYAETPEELENEGMQIFPILWDIDVIADFPTFSIVQRPGDLKSKLFISINAFKDVDPGSEIRYIAHQSGIFEVNKDKLNGHFYVLENIGGSSIRPAEDYLTSQNEILGFRIQGSIETRRLDTVVVNPQTNVMTLTQPVGSLDILIKSGGCKRIPPGSDNRICLSQAGSEVDIEAFDLELQKVVPIVKDNKGKSTAAFHMLVDVRQDPNIPATNLFATTFELSPDGKSINSKKGNVYMFKDSQGNDVNITDPQTIAMPDGSIHVLAIAANFENTNAIIELVIDPDGKPNGSAKVVYATNEPFLGASDTRLTGHYNGYHKTNGITFYSFYVGSKGILLAKTDEGYTVEIKEIPEPTPTAQPTPTIEPTATPVNSKSLFLPITRK